MSNEYFGYTEKTNTVGFGGVISGTSQISDQTSQEVRDICGNCLNRDIETGICQGPGVNSGTICSEKGQICDNFDSRSE